MAIATFIIVCLIMLWVEFGINRRLINVFTIFAVPYMLIIPMNNLVMINYGFYEISDEVIFMILTGLFFIFIGSLFANYTKSVTNSQEKINYTLNKEKFEYYKMNTMLTYVFFVETITFLRLLFIAYQMGLWYIGTDEYSGTLLRGPLGHIFLTTYPLIPIVFYYWLKHKEKWSYLLATIIDIVLLFFTFVKYHSICMVLLIYLFISMEDSKYIKKGAAAVATLVCSAFILSYFVSFIIRGATTIKENFYLMHLWNYIGGSVIYDNRIFDQGVRVGTSILYKLGSFTLTPISKFTEFLFDIYLCPHEALPHEYVGINGERGNVVDAIGYLYPSQGSIDEIIEWGLLLIIIGFLFTKIYFWNLKQDKRFFALLCAFMVFFMSFSFFGTFYVHYTCWEILFWCAVMPRVFDRRVHVILGTFDDYKRIFKLKNTD